MPQHGRGQVCTPTAAYLTKLSQMSKTAPSTTRWMTQRKTLARWDLAVLHSKLSDRPRAIGLDSITNGLRAFGHLWLAICYTTLASNLVTSSQAVIKPLYQHSGGRAAALIKQKSMASSFLRDAERAVLWRLGWKLQKRRGRVDHD
jgi:hypothetical protein